MVVPSRQVAGEPVEETLALGEDLTHRNETPSRSLAECRMRRWLAFDMSYFVMLKHSAIRSLSEVSHYRAPNPTSWLTDVIYPPLIHSWRAVSFCPYPSPGGGRSAPQYLLHPGNPDPSRRGDETLQVGTKIKFPAPDRSGLRESAKPVRYVGGPTE